MWQLLSLQLQQLQQKQRQEPKQLQQKQRQEPKLQEKKQQAQMQPKE